MKVLLYCLLFCSFSLSLLAQDAPNGPPPKPIIAVLDFKGNSDQVEAVHDAVEAAFLKSKRFVLVERSQIDQLTQEMKTQDVLSDQAVASLGKTLGAQFVVMGNLSQIATAPVYTKNVKTGQNELAGYSAVVNFEIRVVNVETSQIQVAENLQAKAPNQYSYHSADEASADAVNQVRVVTYKFVEKQFPVMVNIINLLSEKKGEAETVEILGGTYQGLTLKDRLDVVEIQTRDIEGRRVISQIKLGELRVDQLTGDETSVCKVMSGGDKIKQKLDAKATLKAVFYGRNNSLFNPDN